MINKKVIFCLVTLTILFSSTIRSENQLKADIVFKNGNIYTVNPKQPWAEAVAIANNLIIYVGNDNNAQKYIGSTTKVVDLHQNMMLPGLHDNHIHPALGIFFSEHLYKIKAASKKEVFAKLAEAAKTDSHNNWLVAYGLDSTDCPDFVSEKITSAELDAIVPDKILVVLSRDAHTAWLNTLAMKHFNITKDTPDPETGKIVRDPKTRDPIGGLVDKPTIAIVKQIIEKSPYAVKIPDLLAQAITLLNSLGITSFVDALGFDDIIKGYYELEKNSKLNARVGVASIVTEPDYKDLVPHYAKMRDEYTIENKLMPRWIKVIIDGNPDDHLSYLLKPYTDDANAIRKSYWGNDAQKDMVALSDGLGMTTYSHIIGDGAARHGLDAIENARKQSKTTNQPLRHVLTHNFMVDTTDLKRYKELQVIADIQEGWLAPAYSGGAPGSDATEYLISFLGKDRAYSSLPFRALYNAGATLTGGSDWYYTNLNPWENIYTGITSKDPHIPSHAMLPSHTLDLTTLIKMHTINGAYLMYQEKITGSIEVGKRADLIVINQNLFKIPKERIKNTKVLMTLLDGKVIYEAKQ